MPKIPLRRSPRPGHLIVCGSTPLARRLVEELATRYEETVKFIHPPLNRRDKHRLEWPGVDLVEMPTVDEDALNAADIQHARAIALVDQDDVGNIHLALRARQLNTKVRLVVHFFNTVLGRRVSTLLGDCVSMSDSGVAGPSFVAAAMDDSMTINHVRLPGRTLFATSRPRAKRHKVVCGLACEVPGDRPRMLPENDADADIVLAVADGKTTWLTALLRRMRTPYVQFKSLVSGQLRWALFVFVALLVLGTVLFALDPDYSVWEAIYLTLLDVAGAADPGQPLEPLEKIAQVVITVVGISIIPLLTAAVVDAVVSARLNGYGSRLRGHVVVVGLGNVGTRVIRRLHDLGIPVVCVERNENALGVRVARNKRMRIPLIIGDATGEETLRAAGVNHCRALLAVTSDDITNLETGLQAAELRDGLRVVLRVGDDDLAARVENAFAVNVSRSVSYLAAPAFAAAMIEREVIGTLPVGRRVLLVAQVPVRPGSPLYEHQLADVHDPGKVKVIGLRRRHETRLDWSPSPTHTLSTDDELIVVATRTGLGQVLASSIED